jgi:methionyl aminopeptidase
MNLIKTEAEIENMRQAGKIWAQTMNEIEKLIKPGISLKEINQFAEKRIREQGGIPGFLGYKPESAKQGFPATICASVNEIFVHAPPSSRELKEGDIITIDMGVVINGYHVDAAVTFPVGKISEEAKSLMTATKEALDKAIKVVKAGATLGDIGATIEEQLTCSTGSYWARHWQGITRGANG